VVDINETGKKALKIAGNSVFVDVPAYEVVTLAVEFK